MGRLLALVWLRWRMDLRTMLWARERALGLLLVVPGLLAFSLGGALLAFLGVRAVLGTDAPALLPLLSALATVAGASFALSPLLAGRALAETHDLTRLVHFPVPLRTLVAASLLSNLAQPLVLGQAPILLALALALAGSPASLPFTVAGVALSFAFVLASAQLVGLVLLGLSRNRRLHDVFLFVGLGLGSLLGILPLLLLVAGPGPALRFVLRVDPFAASPFAWGARAAVHAGRGETLPAAGLLVLATLAVGGVLAASAALAGRVHRGELSLGGAGGASAPPARMPLPGAVGALVEKDLRSAWREPALKASLVVGLVGPLVLLALLAQAPPVDRGGALLALGAFLGLSGFGGNAFGWERRGLALLLGFPVARWRVLVAKNLSAMALRAPGLLLLPVAGAVMGPLPALPAALVACLVSLLLSAALDNYVSILFPVAVPEPGRGPYSAGGSRGLGSVGIAMAALAATTAVAAPFLFLVFLPLLLEAPALWFGSLPLALAGAVSVYGMLVAGAERLLLRREVEVLERVLGES